VFPPERQGDQRSERRTDLQRHIREIVQLQVTQHEDGEKRRRQESSKSQTGAKNDELKKVALSNTGDKHEESKIAGGISSVRWLIHLIDKISRSVARQSCQRKNNKKPGAVRNYPK